MVKKLQHWLNVEWTATKILAPLLVSIMSIASVTLVKINWNMSQTLVKIEASIAPLSEKIAKVEIKQDNADKKISQLEVNAEKTNGRVSVIESIVNELRGNRYERKAD